MVEMIVQDLVQGDNDVNDDEDEGEGEIIIPRYQC